MKADGDLQSLINQVNGLHSADSDFHVPGQASVPEKSTATTAAAPEQPATEPTDEQIQEAVEQGEKYKFSEEELNEVCDKLIFEGYYEESFDFKGKLKFTFRSRSTQDTTDIAMYMDSQTVSTYGAFKALESSITLAHSLSNLKGRDLTLLPVISTDKDVKTRMSVVNSLPGPMINFLLRKLEYFDAKVFKACEDPSLF